MVLHQGRVLFDGAPEEAVRIYYKTLPALELRDSDQAVPGGYGTRKVQIESCTWEDDQRTVTVKPLSGKEALVDTSAQSPIVVSSGESVCIKISLLSEIAFEASVGILIRDRFGQDIFGVNTAMLNLPVSLVPGQTGNVDFRISIDLAPGVYTLTTAVHTDTTHIHDCQHWWDNALEFEVVGFKKAPFSGIVGLACQATFTKTQ
jgi:lipopolysaccharide transport system ATP-binding protein